ncbi:MAG: hypothetical protein IJV60_03530 [Prevotella sp.]|nr:hypothetical protein [Prevotella sp.]
MRYRRIIWLLALFLATMVCRAQTSINLTENSDGTWTLDQMPAYNVKLIVEYEDALSQAIDLTDNGDGTWTLDQMPAYNVKLIVEYEDDLSQAIDLTDNGDGTWTLDQMPNYNVKLVVEYEDENATDVEVAEAEKGETLKAADVWYTIDGRRLIRQPAKKGIYINNGRKLVVR